MITTPDRSARDAPSHSPAFQSTTSRPGRPPRMGQGIGAEPGWRLPAYLWTEQLKTFSSVTRAELEVFGLIHHTHSAAADLAEDAVMGDRLPNGLGRRGHL